MWNNSVISRIAIFLKKVKASVLIGYGRATTFC